MFHCSKFVSKVREGFFGGWYAGILPALMREVEEKFLLPGELRDARENLGYTTCFWTNLEQNCLQNAKVGSAKISNFGLGIQNRSWF